MNIIICEDDVAVLDIYKLIVKDYASKLKSNSIKLVLATPNPNEVEKYINQNTGIDTLYLLDIEFTESKQRGIDLAVKIRENDQCAKIVFITTHEEMTVLTFQRKVEPLDFIEKELGLSAIQAELIKDIDIAINRFSVQTVKKRRFVYHLGSRDYSVDCMDINFFETSSNPHKVILHTIQGVVEFRSNLNNIEYDNPSFLRVHKSLLVNLSNVKYLDSKNRSITFKSGGQCEIARRKMSSVRKKMKALE